MEAKEYHLKRIYLTLCIVLLLLPGCASKYRVDAIEVPTASIPSGSHFYVMLSDDGHYGAKVYTGSGQMVTASVQRILRAHGAEVTLATQIEDLDQALENGSIREYCLRRFAHDYPLGRSGDGMEWQAGPHYNEVRNL